MRVVLFILFLLPIITYSQITVIEIADQPDIYESCCGEVIEGGRFPRYNPSSWYGNPDVTGLSNSQTSNIWFSTEYGPRTFYTNISEPQRIFRGDSIHVIAGGGKVYEWDNGETTRVIKVSPQETTQYSVTIKDDMEYDPSRVVTLYTTVYVEDAPLERMSVNIGDDYTICSGQTIKLIPTYESVNATYKWSTGDTTREIEVTPSSSQTYFLEITEFGITKSDRILIIVNDCK